MCLKILYYNTMERGSKDITKLKSDNIVIQLGYNAITLHEKHTLKLTITIIPKVTPKSTTLLVVVH
jgi:hypothetical protein